jgi:hypothetical protein
VLNPDYGSTVAAFRHTATLHRNKSRSCTARSRHTHTPPQGVYVDRRPVTRVTAPEVVPRLPPKGLRVYGTRNVYMKRYPGHGTSSLKELVGVEVRQTYFPSVGRRTKVGISQPPWKRRWGYLERRARARISLPTKSVFGGRAVLLPPLVGRSLHTVYGPCIPPSLSHIVVCS